MIISVGQVPPYRRNKRHLALEAGGGIDPASLKTTL